MIHNFETLTKLNNNIRYLTEKERNLLDCRKITNYNQLPEKVKKAIQLFIDKYDPEIIKLGGSFTWGYWLIDDVSNDDILNIRKEVYCKDKESDIDLYTDLKIISTEQFNKLNIDHKPLVCNDRCIKVTLYKKNKGFV
jgi:hypothetical protein